MRQKENYVAPELTVVEFKVERGFAASSLATLGDLQIGFEMQAISQKDLMMGDQMTDASDNFSFGGQGYGVFGNDGNGQNYF